MTEPAAERTPDPRATDAVTAGEADTPDVADFRPLSLPRRALIGILLGGAQFLVGVIGVESLNGRHLAASDWIVENRYIYGTMIEELLEMSGIAVALAALISLFQHDARSGHHRLDPAVQRRAPAPTA
ncbi:hypothetical protein [Brachybacterium sp. GU-2]|uniref:hypothetical protein n=1 Tax=Brachybacterium sp. GU-2 TaxID=3069708 RepID=UPI00280AE0DC|nr:hypothetical protein [Brachybacterium sp. GU-2]WME24299.1 hypothetical protein RBL05_06230 [Brachybacterium sp. GU-2]